MKVKGMIESDVDTFKVGDVIEVKLTDGVKVQAMAGQQEEDGMVFCLVDCLPSEYPMNSTSTNEGGYEESDLRKKLNKATEQTTDSLEEFRQCQPDDVCKLKVKEHYPEYRNPKRNFPGCVFLVGKHTHVMQGTSGSHNGKADGYYDTNGNSYSSGECKFVANNEGIVFA